MGRLKNLAPRVGALKPRIARRTDSEGHSRVERWRNWYSLAAWKALRLRVFARDHYTCQCGCGVMEGDTSLLVADHIARHNGDPVLFWDENNVQTLRKSPCHDRIKQAEERRGVGG